MSAVPAEIAGIGSTAMKLRVSPGFDPLKAQIGPDEYFLLSRIDGSQTLREVILATGLPVDRAVTIVTKLRTIGAVLLPGEAAPPKPPAPAPKPPVVAQVAPPQSPATTAIGTQPIVAQPAIVTQPVVTQPARPVVTQPAQPVVTQPATVVTQPAQPVATQPVVTQPAQLVATQAAQPVVTQAAQPVVTQPSPPPATSSAPPADQPVASRTTTPATPMPASKMPARPATPPLGVPTDPPPAVARTTTPATPLPPSRMPAKAAPVLEPPRPSPAELDPPTVPRGFDPPTLPRGLERASDRIDPPTQPRRAAPPPPDAAAIEAVTVRRPPSQDITIVLPNPTDAERAALAEQGELDPDTRLRILAMARLVDVRDPYALLGVPNGADHQTLKRAYFKLSKEIHPDRFFGRQLGSFADRLSVVFEAVSRAYARLTSPEKSRPHSAQQAVNSEQPQTPGEYAAELFERACSLEVGGDALGAMKLFAAAVRIDPQTRYLRRAASCALQAEQPKTALEYAKKAQTQAPSDPSAARLLAFAFKATGRYSDAEEVLVMAMAMKSENDVLTAELRHDLVEVRRLMSG